MKGLFNRFETWVARLFWGEAEVNRRRLADEVSDLITKEMDWLEANMQNLTRDEFKKKVEDIRFLISQARRLI